MKRGTFVVFAILILIFSSVSVNADLVDWFTQDHAGSLSNENQITGLSFFGDFFNSIGNFFKKLLGQEQVGFAGSSGKSYDFNNDGCVDIGDEGFVFDINGDGNTQDDLIALQSNFETDCEPIGIETVTDPPVEHPSTLPPVENPPAAKVAETQACVPGTALTGDELLKNLDKAEPKGVIDLEDLIVFNAAPFDADGNGCVDLTQDGSVYAAKNGETYVIAGQQAFTCQGTASENAVLCANDDKDLTEQNSKLGNILVTGDTNHGCTNLRKCEYYCADNYEKQGTGENAKCALKSIANACVPGTALTGDELLKKLDKAEPKGVIDLEDLIVFNAAPFDADGNGCVDLTQDGSVYAAKNGETYVIAGQQAFTCQGTASENAVLCANDDKDLTEQNSKLGNILVTGDTNHGCTNLRKCEYYCADNYEKQGTGENAKCAPKITPPSGKGSGKFTKEQLQKLDIDGSGKIDFEDFFAFAASFDKKPGDVDYNAKADFTKTSG